MGARKAGRQQTTAAARCHPARDTSAGSDKAGGGPAGGSRQPPHLPGQLIPYPVFRQSGCSSTPLPPRLPPLHYLSHPFSFKSCFVFDHLLQESFPVKTCQILIHPPSRNTSSTPSHSFLQELPTITWSCVPVPSMRSYSCLTLDRRKNGLGVSCFLKISSILSCRDVKLGIQDRNSSE